MDEKRRFLFVDKFIHNASMNAKFVKFVRKQWASKSLFLMAGYEGDRYLTFFFKWLRLVEKGGRAK